MRLAELLTIVVGDVNLFERNSLESDDPFRDLYRGKKDKIPKELLAREVFWIGGARARRMDICLTPDGK